MILGGTLFALAVPPAEAKDFVTKAHGVVADLHDSDLSPISGSFKKGDKYSLSVIANLDAASFWFTGSDKATAFYQVPVMFKLISGSYQFSGGFVQTLSIINNSNCSGLCASADSAYFLSLGFSQVSGKPPFDLGAGSCYHSLSIPFFDFYGNAFNGTDLDQLAKVAAFSAPTFSYQLTQVNTPSKAAFVTFTNASYTAGVSGAVPESATWATMVVGMAAIGFTMRRRADAFGRKPAPA
jgi:hypothetical protein